MDIKKLLPYSGVCSVGLTFIAFLLLMVTPAVHVDSIVAAEVSFLGVDVIFGNGGQLMPNLSGLGLTGWIFSLVALLGTGFTALVPFVKQLAPAKKYSNYVGLGSGVLLLAAGIFAFFIVPTFMGANGWSDYGNTSIGAGWVIAGIMEILGGGVAVVPFIYSLFVK